MIAALRKLLGATAPAVSAGAAALSPVGATGAQARSPSRRAARPDAAPSPVARALPPILRWGPGAYFQPDPPETDHAGLTAFLEAADFYEDGDCLYATDGDRLFAFSLPAQEWAQLTAWPPGRRLTEMPRARFEAMFGAGSGPTGAEHWEGASPTDRHHMLVLSLLAQQAVQGGHFCEVHIPADPGPALYLLMTQADWTAVLAGAALSLANDCEIAPGEVRLYRFVFNASGLGEIAVSMQTEAGMVLVHHGGWHRLATRVVKDPGPAQ